MDEEGGDPAESDNFRNRGEEAEQKVSIIIIGRRDGSLTQSNRVESCEKAPIFKKKVHTNVVGKVVFLCFFYREPKSAVSFDNLCLKRE